MKNKLLSILFLYSSFFFSQVFDAQKYTYTVMLNEHEQEVKVQAQLDFKKLVKEKETLKLNLIQYDSLASKGMKITNVELNGIKTSQFKHNQDTVYIPIANDVTKFSVSIQYQGIPKDGLIISTLGNQDKTFFSDHWPNRARHWLASIDQPSDKAHVRFKIYAPKGYHALANGELKAHKTFDKFSYFDWETRYQIPTKVMAMGVAKFQSKTYQEKPLTISGHTFDGDPNHYEKAVTILKWFENKIAPYPFQKLANVQSKTRYGGMENAGCIFYNEKSVQTDAEQLIAHEIAHQWFGNTVTEKNFTHLWLSEGFATFLEMQYVKETYGDEAYQKVMKEAQVSVIQFHKRFPNFVLVPQEIEDPNLMLNPYSYQKGAWLLHSLKKELGDALFWEIIRGFYQEYAFKNVDSESFKTFVEQKSKKDLTDFFNLWLYNATLPAFEL